MTAAAQRGTTTITDRAVRRISERAAGEVLAGSAAARPARGTASVRGRRAEVSLDVTLPYPAPLAETVRGVQEHVAGRTRELTGLDVPGARVEVTAFTTAAAAGTSAPGTSALGSAATASGEAGRTPRRLWSRRRIPAAVLAAVAAVVCGALAADLVRVHTTHHAAAAWRVTAAHWAAGHGPGDTPVVVAGGLTALLGLWMVVLAVTPGMRRRATVLAPAPRVVAAVDRSAVESLVRDAVGRVAGIGAVRVRVRRHRVTVRAGLLFGERGDARAGVTAAAGAAVRSCGLRRAPRLRVRVTPEAVWQPPAAAADARCPAGLAGPADPAVGGVPDALEGEV
ncbi:DUF6286 domain-containing protein [Streptomyces sp. NPDC004542]|uniref:DUF6286 domain-containing Asp23/Gls24 family envelope stress response protein n=1 Tax=Streptomyces sp. NPDC004542 TaxID=3154281 RepID=UPI0033B4358A